jgi:hypothetical protein
MEIKVTKGPLDAEHLHMIAELYGSYDKKYASVDFCRKIFNENPSGYSYHSFAYDNGEAIGHCATIPMEIYARGETELSAKAEALFLKAEHRSKQVKEGNLEVPAVVAIAAYLYKFTLEDPRVRVIHGICDDVIGLIHRMAGCRRRATNYKKYVFISDSKFMSKAAYPLWKRVAFGTVFTLQQALFGLSYLVLLLSGKLLSYEFRVGSSNQPIEFIASAFDASSYENVWTLAMHPANLSWFFDTDLLETVTTKHSVRQCAVIKKNQQQRGDLEVVAYNSLHGGILGAIGILYYVIRRAKEYGAGRVVFSNLALQGGAGSLQSASKLLGFVGRNEESLIFLKASDDFFLKKGSFLFNPLLHAVF